MLNETMLVFNGSPSDKAKIRRDLQDLNKAKLWKAFQSGETDYILETPTSAKEGIVGGLKSLFTLFVPDVARFVKAMIRMPKESDITDQNASIFLSNFLTDEAKAFWGKRNDKKSFKYRVVSHLFGMAAESDAGAEEMVNAVIKELRASSSPAIELN